ncbi:hypothetical protein [Parapedobacter sp. DT-150]|uniref:hypothetical protein n=1 Tax=Parapedobacter sp. DT-150 TaxID=3396162 RepID=UPI003F1A819A
MEKSEIGSYILDTPAYKFHYIDKLGKNIVEEIILYIGSIDCYCTSCGSYSVFTNDFESLSDLKQKKVNLHLGYDRPGSRETFKIPIGLYSLDFACTRNNSHKLYFIFNVEENRFRKIGQSPSALEINRGKIDKYKKILGDNFSDLNSAIVLHSNGFGVAAFTHLRRIIENYFMKDAVKTLIAIDTSFNIEKYKALRFKDKFQKVKDFLPHNLTENQNIYRISSSGIHNLNEDQCLSYFPVLKECICLSLDEKLEEIKKTEAKERIKNELSKIETAISSTSDE